MPQKLAEMEEKNAPINGEHSSGKASCLESSIEALERCRAGEIPRSRDAEFGYVHAGDGLQAEVSSCGPPWMRSCTSKTRNKRMRCVD